MYSASDTFTAPRGIDLLVTDKMEGVRIIVISTVVKLFAFHINHVISQSMRTSRKEVVYDISSIIPRAIWDVKRSCSRQKSP